ncbi:unnamed protein product [Parascedosporium putredinis]|uniref:Uncharacterized protein n=1 Tax=Parascedosporium putredinis TaxID=1442378 RepID=A0A9P1H1D7_9PEZI|nr:unnamed protein product [Parascedosporium putredinis]CAI7993558.1 unnamed protein product [Parascedosporium putredinis]
MSNEGFELYKMDLDEYKTEMMVYGEIALPRAKARELFLTTVSSHLQTCYCSPQQGISQCPPAETWEDWISQWEMVTAKAAAYEVPEVLQPALWVSDLKDLFQGDLAFVSQCVDDAYKDQILDGTLRYSAVAGFLRSALRWRNEPPQLARLGSVRVQLSSSSSSDTSEAED